MQKINKKEKTDDLLEQLNCLSGFTNPVMVHPCVIDNKNTLVFERGLQQKKPEKHKLIANFAQKNGYQLKEDQRADFIEGVKRVKNKSHANLLSIVLITASLFSPPAFSMTKSKIENGFITEELSTHQHFDGWDMEHIYDEQALMKKLLIWLNKHSAFEHDISNLPEIVKVSANEMLHVAFGNELPKSIDATTLKIYGLYNFNEKAIYILDSIDMTTDEGKAILLHELVHFLQYQNKLNLKASCKNELESLAYQLETKYLTTHGHRNNISTAHINQVSRC